MGGGVFLPSQSQPFDPNSVSKTGIRKRVDCFSTTPSSFFFLLFSVGSSKKYPPSLFFYFTTRENGAKKQLMEKSINRSAFTLFFSNQSSKFSLATPNSQAAPSLPLCNPPHQPHPKKNGQGWEEVKQNPLPLQQVHEGGNRPCQGRKPWSEPQGSLQEGSCQLEDRQGEPQGRQQLKGKALSPSPFDCPALLFSVATCFSFLWSVLRFLILCWSLKKKEPGYPEKKNKQS